MSLPGLRSMSLPGLRPTASTTKLHIGIVFRTLNTTKKSRYNNNNNNNNTSICKAHDVSIRAESEAPAVARWRGWLEG